MHSCMHGVLAIYCLASFKLILTDLGPVWFVLIFFSTYPIKYLDICMEY